MSINCLNIPSMMDPLRVPYRWQHGGIARVFAKKIPIGKPNVKYSTLITSFPWALQNDPKTITLTTKG